VIDALLDEFSGALADSIDTRLGSEWLPARELPVRSKRLGKGN